MRRRFAAAFVGCTLFLPTAAEAICVEAPLSYYVNQRYVALIFRGTVRETKAVPFGQIVTFDVDRVWKGRVPRQFTFYNDNDPASIESEEVTFVVGMRHLIIAHRHTAESQQRLGLDAAAVLRMGLEAVPSSPATMDTRLADCLLFVRCMKQTTTSYTSALQKNPDEWKTGDEPMTAAQRSYLETLANDVGESFDDNLTKAEASQLIDELRQRSPRVADK